VQELGNVAVIERPEIDGARLSVECAALGAEHAACSPLLKQLAR
jgi:hypothetical protein